MAMNPPRGDWALSREWPHGWVRGAIRKMALACGSRELPITPDKALKRGVHRSAKELIASMEVPGPLPPRNWSAGYRV